MSDELNWTLSLVDHMSGPAKQAASGLERVEKQLKKTGKEAEKANKPSGAKSGLAGMFTELNGALGAVDKVSSAIGEVASVVSSLGKSAIAVTAFKESTLTAFKTLAGADIGDALFKQVLEASRAFAIAPEAAMNSVKALLGAGFDAKRAMEVFASATDLSKLTGGDAGALTAVMGQILSKGKLQTEELLQLAESGGLAMGKVFDEIGKLKGIDSSTAAGKSQITKLLEGGQIDANTGIQAAMNAIKGMTGKEAGQFSKDAATGIGSLLTKLQTAPEALFMSLDTSGATESLRNLLMMLNDLFDPNTAGGQKVVEVMQALADAAAEIMDTISGGDLSGAFGKIADALISILPAISGFSSGALEGLAATLGPLLDGMSSAGASAETWKSLGKAIGIVAGAFVWVGTTLAESFTWFYRVGAAIWDLIAGAGSLGDVLGAMFGGGLLADLITSFGEGAASIAGNFIDGLVQGIKDGIGSVVDACIELASSVVSSISGALDINSPSGVARDLFGHVGGGAELGLEDGAPGVAKASAGLATASVSGMSGGMIGTQSGGGGGTTNYNTFTIHIAPGATVDGATIESMKSAVTQSVAEAYGE